MSMSRAWEETSAFLTREQRLIVPLTLALLFLPMVLVGLAAPEDPPAGRAPSGIHALLFLVQLLVGGIGQLAIARLALGHREQLGATIRHAARRLPAYVGTLLVIGLPLSIALALIFTASKSLTPGGGAGNAGLALLLLLATVVLMVSLLILVARFSITAAVIAAEPGGPITIVRRVLALTRGEVLRLLGTLLLFLLGSVVAIVALTTVVGSLVRVALGPPAPWTVGALLIAVAGAAAQAAIGAVFAVLFARLYAQRAEISGS